MADESVDAVWFARGGYGSNRIAEAACADLRVTAMRKTYLGYSDAGFLLAGLHKAGCELLIEEVSEHHYRIDRLMFHITGSANVRKVAELRLGNVSDVPENDPVWGSDEEAIVKDWCARAGLNYGGRASIGHDATNRVVPFGRTPL